MYYSTVAELDKMFEPRNVFRFDNQYREAVAGHRVGSFSPREACSHRDVGDSMGKRSATLLASTN